jgi:hypothetical protein
MIFGMKPKCGQNFKAPIVFIETGSNLSSNSQLVKRMNLLSTILGRAEKCTTSGLLPEQVTEWGAINLAKYS